MTEPSSHKQSETEPPMSAVEYDTLYWLRYSHWPILGRDTHGT